MSNSNANNSKLTTLSKAKIFLSIKALRLMERNNEPLTPQQNLALKNYDRYRIKELNAQITAADFNRKYEQLQAKANLTPFEEFLKEEYC